MVRPARSSRSSRRCWRRHPRRHPRPRSGRSRRATTGRTCTSTARRACRLTDLPPGREDRRGRLTGRGRRDLEVVLVPVGQRLPGVLLRWVASRCWRTPRHADPRLHLARARHVAFPAGGSTRPGAPRGGSTPGRRRASRGSRRGPPRQPGTTPGSSRPPTLRVCSSVTSWSSVTASVREHGRGHDDEHHRHPALVVGASMSPGTGGSRVDS